MTNPELLDDYTKATFPYEVKWDDDGGLVRLYAAFGDRVVGASYWVTERNGERVESLRQALDWNGQGKFGTPDVSYPSMDLPPPPAKVGEHIARIELEIAEAEARLAANPDAPEAWRSVDERTVSKLRTSIDRLRNQHPAFSEAA